MPRQIELLIRTWNHDIPHDSSDLRMGVEESDLRTSLAYLYAIRRERKGAMSDFDALSIDKVTQIIQEIVDFKKERR
jgi:hypothetical protein